MLSSIKQKAPGQAQQKPSKSKKKEQNTERQKKRGKHKKKEENQQKTTLIADTMTCRGGNWARDWGRSRSWPGRLLEIERVARICTAPQGKMPASVAGRQPRRIHVEYEAKCQFGEIYTCRYIGDIYMYLGLRATGTRAQKPS